ncbi:MAG: hypothetical protein PUI06_07465 [Prevotella sp.]|nr:hypothetical protein [Prevotella sp.]
MPWRILSPINIGFIAHVARYATISINKCESYFLCSPHINAFALSRLFKIAIKNEISF